jgi:glycosyltransferase involved in cell wall biosynthesis
VRGLATPVTDTLPSAALRPLRVCLVCFSAYPDQGATYFFEMARSLAALGHDVHAVAVQRQGEAADAVEDGVHVRRLPLHLTMSWASPQRWLAKVRFLREAARIIHDGRFDVAHVYCTIGAALIPLSSGGTTRWVLEHQTGAVSSRHAALRWMEDRLRAAQGRAFDVNLTVTEVLGRRLFGRRPFESVPAGVNPALFRPGLARDLRRELGVPDQAIVFVHAGVLEAERATDVPIRAFARAYRKNDRLWLLMPGKGAQLEDLRALAGHLGVADRVWLPGYVPYTEIPRVLAAADAGLSYLPAVKYYEGQPPMKVFEYLGAGLPVIASDVPSHRGIVRHGENGLLSAPTAEGYAEAMLMLAADVDLRDRLSAGSRSAISDLTYDRIAADRVIPIYRRILAAGDRAR